MSLEALLGCENSGFYEQKSLSGWLRGREKSVSLKGPNVIWGAGVEIPDKYFALILCGSSVCLSP